MSKPAPVTRAVRSVGGELVRSGSEVGLGSKLRAVLDYTDANADEMTPTK